MAESFTINPWGLTGVFAVLLAWSLAVFLLRGVERDRLAVLFAVVLVVEGLVLATSGAVLIEFFRFPYERDLFLPHHIADCMMLVVYPIFLAYALPQSGLRVLRHPAALPLLLVFATVVCIADWWFIEFWVIAVLLSLMFTLALIFAIHAVFMARSKLARQRAILFSIAFGFRDVVWAWVYFSGAFGLRPEDPTLNALLSNQLYAGATLIYIPMVAYGILSLRLLDLRVQMRLGVKRGTLAAAFVAIFFLISESAASLLSDQFGTVFGLLGASLVVFLVSPLHRLAEWFSGQVVQVDQGGEYKAYRKLQMYAAAVEDALLDGKLGTSQRALLERLRESLEMSAEDARRIEADFGLHPASA